MNPNTATVLTQNLRTLLHGPNDPVLAVKMRDMIAVSLKAAYEAETQSTAELMAENNKMSYALHQIAHADNQQELEREFLPWAQNIAREALGPNA